MPLAYFDKLKPSCVDSGVSFEDRVARRKEELRPLRPRRLLRHLGPPWLLRPMWACRCLLSALPREDR